MTMGAIAHPVCIAKRCTTIGLLEAVFTCVITFLYVPLWQTMEAEKYMIWLLIPIRPTNSRKGLNESLIIVEGLQQL